MPSGTEIRTPRLDLLPLRVGHATEMAGVLADPALHRFIGGTPYPPDALTTRYRRLVAGSPDPEITWLNWVILLREDSRLTGTVQATLSTARRTAEIAWVVGTPWQGRGIAKEAAVALVAWLTACPVRSITAHIHPDHHASAAVARAAGLAPTPERQDGEIRWACGGRAGGTGD
ncbi:GNAT family N-acetyltransferase [Streptomyces sp. NPDC001781]